MTGPAPVGRIEARDCGDRVDVIEVDGALQIVRVGEAETPGERLVRRMRDSRVSQDVEGMSTDEIMEMLRGE
ncbi:AbrB/MazE/SpoVT family DNA-binding domain-containing protein [Streptomyces finlayi]|uniref:AbrB/MazE/SpoVT family DNA-binding domain-containing protein n=1 Tax=Streptomyces finlayi TaxID=67296 RepID=A0A7G7BS37_9ACTN|nr:AbrB/MazE/SpoVT family DNA-binding domain-containing protein [Streptomyces finlayi]QNE78152.1 AbrB/MazE/SpoVT family DNA-binding domain-containing protein [Streptomyces finlayi]